MDYVKPNETRAKVSMMFFVLAIVSDIILFIYTYFLYDLISGEDVLVHVSMLEYQQAASSMELISIISAALYIIAAISFLMWFYRAYSNLESMGLRLSHGKGWIIGSWFVPIYSLFKPYKIMKDMFLKTEEYLVLENLYYNGKFSSGIVNIWWLFLIIDQILINYIKVKGEYVDSISDLQYIVLFTMIGTIFEMIDYGFHVKLIRDYSKVESFLVEKSHDLDY